MRNWSHQLGRRDQLQLPVLDASTSLSASEGVPRSTLEMEPSSTHLSLLQSVTTSSWEAWPNTPSRSTLRTHNEWPGKIDRLGEPFLGAQLQEPVALHLG